jgi:hypothetical protein
LAHPERAEVRRIGPNEDGPGEPIELFANYGLKSPHEIY